MNNIEGQDVGGEQDWCEGAQVPDYQEHVEDKVQNKGNIIIITFTVIFKWMQKCYVTNRVPQRGWCKNITSPTGAQTTF